MVVCDRCESCWHPHCGEDQGHNPIHDGPWYCAACRGHIVLKGFTDVTQDLGLIDYLFRGVLPEQEGEAARVIKLARRYRARGAELETEVNPYGMSALSKWVPVPPVPMRA